MYNRVRMLTPICSNPNIRGYGLPWGFPSWIGNHGDVYGPGHLLTQDQADYVTQWVRGAEVLHHHRIDYIGKRMKMEEIEHE